MKKFLSVSVAFAGLAFAGLAQAGEQYVDGTGYAVSGHDVVAYQTLPQSSLGAPQHGGVPGKPEFSATHNGATWLFSSAANRDAFIAEPAKYAPQYDGHCAYGVSRGGKVPGSPDLWRVVDGKLYLNITRPVVGFWEKDIPGNIVAAETNWSKLEPKPASTNPIPN